MGWSRGRWCYRGDRAGLSGCCRVSVNEESKTWRTYLVSKAEERRVDRPSQESKKPPDTKTEESFQGEKGAAKRQWPSSEVGEKPDVNPEKKFAIPQIIITTPSKETVISYGSMGMQEQRTIQERAEQGPYSRHRNPSTVDAYNIQTTE
ncbi:spermatogenesis-associated protein 33 [Budorcas taxicolor]|uniref:spermatogenesis-associated protein 33 n=1 Tax=Budorcas taxicolor TaxID=37181 RepID=UPI002283F290|nr:spermatogenesis-associated protein 33 [Budorcas taxicolor]